MALTNYQKFKQLFSLSDAEINSVFTKDETTGNVICEFAALQEWFGQDYLGNADFDAINLQNITPDPDSYLVVKIPSRNGKSILTAKALQAYGKALKDSVGNGFKGIYFDLDIGQEFSDSPNPAGIPHHFAEDLTLIRDLGIYPTQQLFMIWNESFIKKYADGEDISLLSALEKESGDFFYKKGNATVLKYEGKPTIFSTTIEGIDSVGYEAGYLGLTIDSLDDTTIVLDLDEDLRGIIGAIAFKTLEEAQRAIGIADDQLNDWKRDVSGDNLVAHRLHYLDSENS